MAPQLWKLCSNSNIWILNFSSKGLSEQHNNQIPQEWDWKWGYQRNEEIVLQKKAKIFNYTFFAKQINVKFVERVTFSNVSRNCRIYFFYKILNCFCFFIKLIFEKVYKISQNLFAKNKRNGENYHILQSPQPGEFRARWFSGSLVLQFSGAPVLWCFDAPVFRCSGSPVLRFSGSPVLPFSAKCLVYCRAHSVPESILRPLC